MSMEDDTAAGGSARRDAWSALFWIVFGGAIAVASWNMDRLENLHINRYEIPGLVPGLLGTAIMALGALLALRSVGRGALRPDVAAPAAEHRTRWPVVAATLIYALVLVGNGLPFWLATWLFVAAFIYGFDLQRQRALGRSPVKVLAIALLIGGLTGVVVSVAFSQVFYVRLP